MSDSVAPVTRMQYKKHRAQFKNFCDTLHLSAKKSKFVEALQLWVAELSKQGASYGSVLAKLAAVRHHRKKSRKDAKLSSHRLELMLRGLKKRRRTGPGKIPVTISHMQRLHKAADSMGNSEALRVKAMTTLAFFGFLRPSELCISRSNHHLRRQDVRINKTNRYCLIKFNTFKHSEGTQVIKIEEQTHGPIRPVKTIRTYLNTSNNSSPSGHQPLFDMTVEEFKDKIAELCQTAGIKSKITPHCFRVGGATWASRQGWPDARIQQHGRWKSGAYKSYIKPY